MMPILYTVIALLLSINIVLVLPKVVDLTQKAILANSIPNNQVLVGENIFTQKPNVEEVKLPPKPLGLPVPLTSAAAVLVLDLDSESPLLTKDPDKRVPIASTTKIMTSLVAAEIFQPNEILVVPDNILEIKGSTMSLKAGEKLTFRSLLYGMLLNSGNDAAYTIAANFPDGVSAFVREMNKKAEELGLINTHFDNPAGYDSPYHFSSASDLSKVATLASKNSQLSRIFATKETSVASVDKATIHPLKNLNKLLNTPGVLGMKTGTTPEAKENLVGLVERNNHKILTVVLGSDDRFGETEKLVDWAYSNFVWE